MALEMVHLMLSGVMAPLSKCYIRNSVSLEALCSLTLLGVV